MRDPSDWSAGLTTPPSPDEVNTEGDSDEFDLTSPVSVSDSTRATSSMPASPLSANSDTAPRSAASWRTGSSSNSRATGKSFSSNLSSASSAASSAASENVPIRARRRSGTPRTQGQETVRSAALVLIPLLLAVPTALILSLTRRLLHPLYNSLPLKLHPIALHIAYVLPSALVISSLTRQASARRSISAGVCLIISALTGDVVAVGGRQIGSVAGRLLGPEWGAFAAQWLLGVGVVGGAAGFALLSYEHLRPVALSDDPLAVRHHAVQVVLRIALYTIQIHLVEWAIDMALSWTSLALWIGPEKLILLVSLFLTLLSPFARPPQPDPARATPGSRLHAGLSRVLRLSRDNQKRLSDLTRLLPTSSAPLFLLLRVPILILALRAQLFAPRVPPYLAADDQLRVLSSARGLTGQIVVAENLRDGYRFLRCDHSILGGKWFRKVRDRAGKGQERTIFGDSIFAAFALQEVGLLAARQGEEDGLARTIGLTTELQLEPDPPGKRNSSTQTNARADRALVIGLGVGIAAQHLSDRGVQVDVVEVDSAVYTAALEHFDFRLPNTSAVSLMDGALYVRQLAQMQRSSEATMPKWDLVIQDCFTGGSVPGELFTTEFWTDVTGLMAVDGIMTMNFAGILHSRASKAVLVTLLSVFTQCRAFSENYLADINKEEMINMVVLCSMVHSPLLSFRDATASDVARSPLRSHVYTHFLRNEIRLDEVVSENDLSDQRLVLKRGKSHLDQWQVGTSLATWHAMQNLLTPDMWLAW